MSDFVITEEVLADGQILDAAVSDFLKKHTKESLYKALLVFRSSKVWLPCRKNEFSINGATEKEVRYTPELITNGDGYYIPIFSNEKYMKEYANVKVFKPVTDIINLAKENSEIEIKGLVLNPFNDSFIISNDIWDSILKMESLVK